MILSSRTNGLRESRPSLLITCAQKITLLLFNSAFYKKKTKNKKTIIVNDSNQPDLVLFLHDEESVSVDVEVGSVQESLQRDQTDDLRANHRQLQLLDTHSGAG